MAKWNHNNTSHVNLTLPNFQPENSLPGNNFHHPTDLINVPLSFLGPNQMKMNNSECNFGYGLPHTSSGYQPSSSFRLPWEINSEVNHHGLSIVAEQKGEWLKMLNQRKLDQDFLNNFMQAQVVQRSQTPLIKEKLEFVNEQLMDRSTSKETQEKILKRKEKREWIKRKKERQKKEAEETVRRREQLNMLIDDERDIIRRNELLRKTHQEAKREADVVLSETRRKRSQITRISQLLNSLRELRSLRARSLESRCALFSKQEDTDNFNSTLDKLDLIIQKKMVDYDEELKTLKLTLKEPHSSKSEETIQKLWSKYSLKGSSKIN